MTLTSANFQHDNELACPGGVLMHPAYVDPEEKKNRRKKKQEKQGKKDRKAEREGKNFNMMKESQW